MPLEMILLEQGKRVGCRQPYAREFTEDVLDFSFHKLEYQNVTESRGGLSRGGDINEEDFHEETLTKKSLIEAKGGLSRGGDIHEEGTLDFRLPVGLMAVGGPSSPPPPLEDGTSQPPLLPKSPCPTNSNMPFSFSDVVQGHHYYQVGAGSPISDSFADKVNGQIRVSEPSTFPLKPVSIYQGKPSVAFSLAEKSELIAHMKFVLIGKFSHGRPPLTAIQAFFVGLKLQGNINLSLLDSKHLVIECVHKADFVRLWLRLIWTIHGFKMRVFKWDDAFNPFKESPIAPVWIRIEGLPIYMFEAKTLMSLANSIGSPLKVDPANLARSNLASARVCVELDISKPLVDAIWVQFVDDKSKQVSDGFWANVYYDVVPVFCSTCFHLGHSVAGCKRGSNGRVSMVQVYDSQVFDNLPKPTSDSAQVVFDKMLQNTGLDTTDSKTTDSKTLQRTNNSCRQITLGLHDQQSTTSCQGPAASRKLSASESKMVCNVVNMSEVHHSTVDNGLQGPKDVHVAVQNSFGILNSEGLDQDSNLQQLEGVDVAAELKRQTACVGNKVNNVAEFAAVQTEAGVAAFPGVHTDRIAVQSQGSKVQDLEMQVRSYSCRQDATDGVTARVQTGTVAAKLPTSKQGAQLISNALHGQQVTKGTVNSKAQQLLCKQPISSAQTQQAMGSKEQQGTRLLGDVVDSTSNQVHQLSWAELAEQAEFKVISQLKVSEAAEYARQQIEKIMQSDDDSVKDKAQRGRAIARGIENKVEEKAWADLAEDDEIETISKLTLSEAKEYAIASSISFKKRRGRPSGRNKRSPR